MPSHQQTTHEHEPVVGGEDGEAEIVPTPGAVEGAVPLVDGKERGRHCASEAIGVWSIQ
jgi:hypothetical protein